MYWRLDCQPSFLGGAGWRQRENRTQIERNANRDHPILITSTVQSMKSCISMMTNSAIHLVPSTKRTDPICLLRLRNRYPIFQKVAIVCTFFFLFSFFCSIVSKRQRPLESTTSYWRQHTHPLCCRSQRALWKTEFVAIWPLNTFIQSVSV